jgi:hypothetical protein
MVGGYYKELRAQGYRAKGALAFAREIAALQPCLLGLVGTAHGDFNLKGLRVTYDFDYDPETPYDGKFTNTWEPGAIRLEDHWVQMRHRGYSNAYKFYIPPLDRATERRYYQEATGTSKGVAEEAVRQQIKDTLEVEKGEKSVYILVVKVWFCGVEVAESSISGVVECDDPWSAGLLVLEKAEEAYSEAVDKIKEIREATDTFLAGSRKEISVSIV